MRASLLQQKEYRARYDSRMKEGKSFYKPFVAAIKSELLSSGITDVDVAVGDYNGYGDPLIDMTSTSDILGDKGWCDMLYAVAAQFDINGKKEEGGGNPGWVVGFDTCTSLHDHRELPTTATPEAVAVAVRVKVQQFRRMHKQQSLCQEG